MRTPGRRHHAARARRRLIGPIGLARLIGLIGLCGALAVLAVACSRGGAAYTVALGGRIPTAEDRLAADRTAADQLNLTRADMRGYNVRPYDEGRAAIGAGNTELTTCDQGHRSIDEGLDRSVDSPVFVTDEPFVTVSSFAWLSVTTDDAEDAFRGLTMSQFVDCIGSTIVIDLTKVIIGAFGATSFTKQQVTSVSPTGLPCDEATAVRISLVANVGPLLEPLDATFEFFRTGRKIVAFFLSTVGVPLLQAEVSRIETVLAARTRG